MAGLIDSSVVIELERRGLPPEALLAVATGEPVVIAAITASELLAGVHRAAVSERRRRREAFVDWVLDGIPVLPFGLREARVHARLGAELAETGRPIGPNDLQIAATALATGYDVLTHNLREFGRVPGLVVDRPSW